MPTVYLFTVTVEISKFEIEKILKLKRENENMTEATRKVASVMGQNLMPQ